MLNLQQLLYGISVEHILLAGFFFAVTIMMMIEMRKSNGLTRSLFWVFCGVSLGEVWSIAVAYPDITLTPEIKLWSRFIQLGIVLVGVTMFTIAFIKLWRKRNEEESSVS